MPWAPPAKDASAGFYDTARLEYRLDAGKLGQPLDVVRVDGRTVSYEQVASSPVANQSLGTLVIQYPHPAGRSGMARVTFSLDSGPQAHTQGENLNPFKAGEPPSAIAAANEEIHEVWAMDIERAESDRYFKLLSTQNFYHAAAKTGAPAELTVVINGRPVRKSWDPLAELNALALRVRRDGQLVGLLRPAALQGSSGSVIASTQAYRELLAQAGRTIDPAPAQAAARQAQTVARLPYAAQ